MTFGGLGGLAFVGQGYDQGAESYWRRKALEDAAAGRAALGRSLSQLTPSPLPGAMPMQSQPQLPTQPTTLQGLTPGEDKPLQPTMDQIHFLTGPGQMPMARPVVLPQNPSISPSPGIAIPQGGFGFGFGSGASNSPVSPAPAAPPPAPPQPRAGGGAPSMPQQGPMNWMQVAQAIKRANPGAPPEVIVEAMNQALPLMQLDSQQQWRQVQEQLRMFQIQNQGNALAERMREFGIREDRMNEALKSLERFRSPEGKAAIATATAEPKALGSTLTKLQGQLGAVNSFEATAISNGRNLLKLAETVDYTGSPVIERWIRAGRKAVAGDPDVTAFDAQLQTWRTEVARIVTNPNLTGVLSNKARQEAEVFAPSGATYEQIKRLISLFESQDLPARKQGIINEINRVKGELQGTTKPAESKPLPGMGEPTENKDGGWQDIPGGRIREKPRSSIEQPGAVMSDVVPFPVRPGQQYAMNQQPPGEGGPGDKPPIQLEQGGRIPAGIKPRGTTQVEVPAQLGRGGGEHIGQGSNITIERTPRAPEVPITPELARSQQQLDRTLAKGQRNARRATQEGEASLDRERESAAVTRQRSQENIDALSYGTPQLMSRFKGHAREEEFLTNRLDQIKRVLANYGEGPAKKGIQGEMRMVQKRLKEIELEENPLSEKLYRQP